MALRIVTFNAGLAVGVLPYASERAPHVGEALARLDADIVFLQEVWLEPHWSALRAAAGARFPHAFRAANTAEPAHGACTEQEIAPLIECAREHCQGLTSDELARCVVRNCMHVAFNMSTACVNCITTHPVGTIDDIVSPCIGTGARREAATEPSTKRSASGEARYAMHPPGVVAYGGSLGTGLMSALPLADVDLLVFDHATLNARGALYARVNAPELGELHLFATHLSPGIATEQRKQIDQLLSWIDEKARPDEPVVLMGDLNTGPGVGRWLTPFGPDLYRRIERAGFHNPYTVSPDPRCTFPGSSLTSGRMGDSGWLLDHVLLRGVPGTASAERIFDEPLTIDVGGRRVHTTYSDHCGIRATISPAIES